jgi:hypothetical protein
MYRTNADKEYDTLYRLVSQFSIDRRHSKASLNILSLPTWRTLSGFPTKFLNSTRR